MEALGHPTRLSGPGHIARVAGREMAPAFAKSRSITRDICCSDWSVFSQPGSILLLMARPRSVHITLGNRYTSTSVKPFFTARWTMLATRLSACSSDTPEGLLRRSSNAFFSASAFALARISSDAFSASAKASCSIICFALGNPRFESYRVAAENGASMVSIS